MKAQKWKEGTVEVNDNFDMEPETYSLTCACCNDNVEYKKFYDFLQHARKEHLPQNTASELSTCQRMSTSSRIALKVCISTADAEPKDSITANNTNKTTELLNEYNMHYDLKKIPRAALVNFINVFRKCLCLWHKPTRMCASSTERFCAYHLLLGKLREHQMQVTLSDVRSILRQLEKNFEMDILRPRTPRLGEDMDKYRLQPTKSRTIVNKLMFLTACNHKIEELNIGKVCDFCHKEFSTYEALWQHMKNTHISFSSTHNCCDDGNQEHQPCNSKVDSRKDQRSRSSNCCCDNYSSSSSEDQFMNTGEMKRKSNRGLNVKLDRTRRPEKRRRLDVNVKSGSLKPKNSPINKYLIKNRNHLLIDFIEHFEQLECLWKQNSNLFRNQKVRNDAIEALVQTQKGVLPQNTAVNSAFIKQLIKELKQYYQSYKAGCMKNNLSKYNTIWERLRFLDAANTVLDRPNNIAESHFHCAICNQGFKTMKNFNLHMVKQHPPTECHKCNKKFDRADGLREHVMDKHVEDAKCPLCYQDAGANNNNVSLKTHLSNHFFDYSCTTCGRDFHDSQSLNKHRDKCLSGIHLKCWHCSDKFNDLQKFYDHSWKLHDDDRPFKCDNCHICFKYLRSLNKHRSIHRLAAKPKRAKP